MVHYTYWIIDKKHQMYYHGVHTSSTPYDINIYSGSCKSLTSAIKIYGIENFDKRVERIFETRHLAEKWEARVHKRLNVATHPKFYNSHNASEDFSAYGKVVVKDDYGNCMSVNKTDSRYINGDLIPVRSGIPRTLSEKDHLSKIWTGKRSGKNNPVHKIVDKDTWRKNCGISKAGLPNSTFQKKMQSTRMLENTIGECRTSVSFEQFRKKMSGINNPKFNGIYCIKGFEFTSPTDAASHFNVTRSTINRWVQTNKDCYKRELTHSETQLYYQIEINNYRYKSAKEASKSLRIHINTIYNRLNSTAWPEYIDHRV